MTPRPQARTTCYVCAVRGGWGCPVSLKARKAAAAAPVLVHRERLRRDRLAHPAAGRALIGGTLVKARPGVETATIAM